MSLGRWAAIDIETTGLDQDYDEIIDLGYLQFDGTRLIKKYSSLVRYEGDLSQFIQKLTGINSSMAKKAPPWREVESHLLELEGHHLIAHNAGFEEKFLNQYFEDNIFDESDQREDYVDSLFFLSLMFPNRSSLSLESFICDLGIAEKEEHRGFADSLDLLKVILIATNISYENRSSLRSIVISLFDKHGLNDYWFAKFYQLAQEDLIFIANQLDFDLRETTANYLQGLETNDEEIIDNKLGDIGTGFSFDGESVGKVFTNQEEIRTVLPNYSFRECQLDMAQRVGQSFKNKLHCLIQAPTGTGKTMAYLVPSALYCLENRESQILIATGTKALQNQAITKDVPQMYSMMGLKQNDIKICRLIGSSNHYCELMFRNLQDESMGQISLKDFKESFTEMFYEILFFYNEINPTEKSITREEIPHVLKRMMRPFYDMDSKIAVDFRACTGHKCPFNGVCSYARGLRAAKEANIIIGNHALMFSWPRGFPRPSTIVVDEAHRLENEATNVFSYVVTSDDLSYLIKSLQNLQGVGALFYLLEQDNENDIVASLKIEIEVAHIKLYDYVKPLMGLIEEYFKRMPRYTSYYWNELHMIKKDSSANNVAMAIRNGFENILCELEHLSSLLQPYIEKWDANSLEDDNAVVAYTRFEIFFCQLADVFEAIKFSLDSDENYSQVLRFHEEYGHSLESKPINVGEKIHDGLLAGSSSVVFTSATLANATGNQGEQGVEWLTGYSYLETDKRFKKGFYLPAIYDYENKSKIFLCSDTAPFYETFFVDSVLKKIMPLVRRLEGRTLFLFSARTRFEKAREILLKEFEGEIPLFIQGMGNNVVEDYKKASSGILLGMEVFGEGIDIPGDSLQFIFIDKIPDIRQEIVIQERREFYQKNFGNEFNDYFLAHRARSLHQKLGRLLRTESDRGGAIIVDSRVNRWKRGTQNAFDRLMKPYCLEKRSLADACTEVGDFILKEGPHHCTGSLTSSDS